MRTPRPRVTESRRLHELFEAYTAQYFADRLPECAVKVTGARRYIHLDAPGHLDMTTGIVIRPGSAEAMRRVLLHEMAHLAVTMATLQGRLRRRGASIVTSHRPRTSHKHGLRPAGPPLTQTTTARIGNAKCGVWPSTTARRGR